MTVDQILEDAKAQGKDDLVQFVEDMVDAGYDVRYYEGRSGWRGPAVVANRSDAQDIYRGTAVKLQTDSMGLDTVYYPEQSLKRKAA